MKLINPHTNKPASIEFLLVSPSFERVVAPYIRNLKKLGITATIRTVDAAQYIKRRETFDFDVIVHWYTQTNAPGNELLNYWHSDRADVQGSLNLIGIKNPAVDKMLEHATNAKSEQELASATRALDRVLLWNFYVVPHWHNRTHRLIYWNKFGRPENTPPFSLGFLDSWWIDEQKKQKLNNKTPQE
jgi:microcin C transport system substrate-binding protein